MTKHFSVIAHTLPSFLHGHVFLVCGQWQSIYIDLLLLFLSSHNFSFQNENNGTENEKKNRAERKISNYKKTNERPNTHGLNENHYKRKFPKWFCSFRFAIAHHPMHF